MDGLIAKLYRYGNYATQLTEVGNPTIGPTIYNRSRAKVYGLVVRLYGYGIYRLNTFF